ncbi:biotin--[acetyl-CoA-carboxylase] ligase, partial [Luminiphilus sp.]|nr:biotin--[acetyl-CoA-carboxylase] ligase [Luminiphilus sp.]
MSFSPSAMNDKPFECDATVLQDQLSESVGCQARVECVERLTSTNAVLKRDALESHGKFLLAGQQSSGVGRRGSVWQSPPEGNLYLSYCFHTETPLADLSLLPLAFALAIADRVESEWAVDIKIKWPNDLFIGGKKCGGILLETASLPGDSSNQRIAVIVGIGINVASHPSYQSIDRPATALQAHVDSPVSVSRVALLVMTAIVEVCRLEATEVGRRLALDWPRRDLLLNVSVSVPMLGDGFGIARGLSPDGGLHVEFQGALETVYAGEVTFGHVEGK